MNSLRAPTNRRRYNVELRIYDTSNNDDGPDLVSLAQVPLGTIQLWIDEFGSSIGLRPPPSNFNICPPPAANLLSNSQRSMIYDRGPSSMTFLSNDRIRVKQGLHKRHYKPCFESGFRASSKKPIRTHLKKYHAEEFKVTLTPQDAPNRYRCCEIEFDIDSWADHVVDRHCHFVSITASSRLDPPQSSSSFQHVSTLASSSDPDGTGSPYQVTLGSSTIGQSGISTTGAQRQESVPYEKLSKSLGTPRSLRVLPTPVSQSRPPLVPTSLLQTLNPITPSDVVHDGQLPFAEDASGNVLFDHHDNRIVRVYDWQQAFALHGAGDLVRDGFVVPISISPGQLLYAYPDPGDRLTYRYGIDVV